MVRSIYDAVMGKEQARLIGPLGLKQANDQSVHGLMLWSSPYPLLYLMAMIHIMLALTNLLPIPALDSGRLAMLAADTLGIRLTPQVQR